MTVLLMSTVVILVALVGLGQATLRALGRSVLGLVLSDSATTTQLQILACTELRPETCPPQKDKHTYIRTYIHIYTHIQTFIQPSRQTTP